MTDEKITYVKVSRFDTLTKIADRNFTTVDKILELNPFIKNKDLICRGDTLKIPMVIFDDRNVPAAGKGLERTNVDSVEIAVPRQPVVTKADSDSIAKTDSLTAPIIPAPAVKKDSIVKADSTVAKTDSTIVKTIADKPAEKTVSAKTNISAQPQSTKSTNDDSSFWGILGAGAVILGAAALATKGKLGKAKNLFQKSTVMKPTQEAEKAVASVEKQMSKPTDYKAVADSYIQKPANHAEKQKELEEAFAAYKPITQPTVEAEKAVASVEKQMSKPTDYKAVADSYIQKPANHAEKQKELEEAFAAYKPITQPTVEAEKAIASVEKQMSKPTDFKSAADKLVQEAPSEEQHKAKLAELYEAFGVNPKIHRKPRHNKKITNLRDLKKKRARERQLAQREKEQSVLAENKKREEYLRSIGLGNAEPSKSSGMTWAKYAEAHGTTYTAPKSGVAEADKRAEQIIKENKNKLKIPEFVTTSTTPSVFLETTVA